MMDDEATPRLSKAEPHGLWRTSLSPASARQGGFAWPLWRPGFGLSEYLLLQMDVERFWDRILPFTRVQGLGLRASLSQLRQARLGVRSLEREQ